MCGVGSHSTGSPPTTYVIGYLLCCCASTQGQHEACPTDTRREDSIFRSLSVTTVTKRWVIYVLWTGDELVTRKELPVSYVHVAKAKTSCLHSREICYLAVKGESISHTRKLLDSPGKLHGKLLVRWSVEFELPFNTVVRHQRTQSHSWNKRDEYRDIVSLFSELRLRNSRNAFCIQ